MDSVKFGIKLKPLVIFVLLVFNFCPNQARADRLFSWSDLKKKLYKKIEISDPKFFSDYQEQPVFLKGLDFPIGLQISFKMHSDKLPAEDQLNLAEEVFIQVPKFGVAFDKPIPLSTELLLEDCGSPQMSCYPYRGGLDQGEASIKLSRPLTVLVFGPSLQLHYSKSKELERIELNVYGNFSARDKKLYPESAYAKDNKIFTPFYHSDLTGRLGLLGWNLNIVKEGYFTITNHYLDVGKAFETFVNSEAKLLRDQRFWNDSWTKLRPKGIYLGDWIACSAKNKLAKCSQALGQEKLACLNRFREDKLLADREYGSTFNWCYAP